tara:strand:+ start:17587 stop:17892 length:306 start_codon:yes stop_codon:yes gene_type:complete
MNNMIEKRQPDPKAQTFSQKVNDILYRVGELLVNKNEQYGDSVNNPVRLFSKLDSEAGVRVRIDDKLSRLARGNDSIESDMDIVDDLIGYLIMLKMIMEEA